MEKDDGVLVQRQHDDGHPDNHYSRCGKPDLAARCCCPRHMHSSGRASFLGLGRVHVSTDCRRVVVERDPLLLQKILRLQTRRASVIRQV